MREKIFLKFYKENKTYLLLFVLSLLVLAIQNFLQPQFLHTKSHDGTGSNVHKEELTSADTYIPAGMVLVPIELTNADSITHFLDPIGGLVDLYKAQTPAQNQTEPWDDPSPHNKRSRVASLIVAKQVKLLRAPLNPSVFAVLLREEQSTQLLSVDGPFFAVIQNPNQPVIEGSKSTRPQRAALSASEVIYGDHSYTD